MEGKQSKQGIKELGQQYLESADIARMGAVKLELSLKAREIKKEDMKNVHLRINMLYQQYRDTKKIGENLISYYKDNLNKPV